MGVNSLKPKRKLLFVFSILLVFATNCTKAPIPNVENAAFNEVKMVESKNLNIDLYIDATPSMSGFAAKEITSTYVNVIEDISSLSTSISGTLGKVRFNSFGENITEITQQQYSGSVREEFYKNSNNRKTMVSTVLEEITNNYTEAQNNSVIGHLSVVITDLFEDNSNMVPIINNIKNNFMTDNMSIGVLGIRSYFKGKVYDIGRDKSGRGYESTVNDFSTYRPFYILLIGNTADVENYYKNLSTKYNIKDVVEECKYFEMFSSKVIIKPGTIEKTEIIKDIKGKKPLIKEDDEWIRKFNDGMSTAIKAFVGGVPENERKNESLISYFDLHLIPGTRLEYAIKSGSNIYNGDIKAIFIPDVIVERYNGKEYLKDKLTQEFVKLDDLSIKDEKLVSKINIYPYNLKEGYYRIRLNVGYNYDYLTPVIPSDWNMKDENDPAFGSKTIYLYNVLEGFYGLANKSKDSLINSCYYFRVIK